MALINLEPAFAVAKQEFAAKDPEAMARNAQVNFEANKQRYIIPFLGRNYYVDYPSGEVRVAGSEGQVSRVVQVLLLHYLINASPAGVQDKLISFKELPSGRIYVGPFTNRAIRPLVAIFGNNASKLIEAGESLGGIKKDLGDAAVTVPALPKIPVTFVIWEGDDEFPPSGNVLFDASAPLHLETEDYAMLPGLVIAEMRNRIS